MALTLANPPRSSWLPAHIGHGVAIFDLDRTLIPGSSLVHLGRELVRRGLLRRSELARHALLELSFRRRGASDRRIERLVRTLLEVAAGVEAQPLRQAAADVGPAIVECIHPTARWLVDRHRDAGDYCVIVSASAQELVDAVAASLGVHRGVGTRIEVQDGRCTGRLDGPFCYGEAKLQRLERELGYVDLTNATGYADSQSDLPVLTACGSAVAVNPDAGLTRIACRLGWPVIRF